MLTFFMAVGFCFVALICKTLLIGARDHAAELEMLIRSHDPQQEPHKTFGVVLSAPKLRWRNLYQTAKHPLGWHVTAFYALIIIVTSLAVVLGTVIWLFSLSRSCQSLPNMIGRLGKWEAWPSEEKKAVRKRGNRAELRNF